ncbi:hypothetical protein DIPPA_15888 [Diplonema papillatum]|nr:hypothetical protein DIPPA_15888 [Diplonema papillatum]
MLLPLLLRLLVPLLLVPGPLPLRQVLLLPTRPRLLGLLPLGLGLLLSGLLPLLLLLRQMLLLVLVLPLLLWRAVERPATGERGTPPRRVWASRVPERWH